MSHKICILRSQAEIDLLWVYGSRSMYMSHELYVYESRTVHMTASRIDSRSCEGKRKLIYCECMSHVLCIWVSNYMHMSHKLCIWLQRSRFEILCRQAEIEVVRVYISQVLCMWVTNYIYMSHELCMCLQQSRFRLLWTKSAHSGGGSASPIPNRALCECIGVTRHVYES